MEDLCIFELLDENHINRALIIEKLREEFCSKNCKRSYLFDMIDLVRTGKVKSKEADSLA
jgi:hypothetical protein